jgi:hypothetical protein
VYAGDFGGSFEATWEGVQASEAKRETAPGSDAGIS